MLFNIYVFNDKLKKGCTQQRMDDQQVAARRLTLASQQQLMADRITASVVTDVRLSDLTWFKHIFFFSNFKEINRILSSVPSMKITSHIAYTKQWFGKQSAAIVTTVTAINVIQTLQVPHFKTVSVLDPIFSTFFLSKLKKIWKIVPMSTIGALLGSCTSDSLWKRAEPPKTHQMRSNKTLYCSHV